MASDELVLLERVFLRVGSADTDEQLQNVLSKFLPPVLRKLSSQQEGVRKKVMELLVHINKRVKSRPLVRLPVNELLVLYQEPSGNSFVMNFTIIYIKMGFPRLPQEEQVELLPTLLNALEEKPQSHQDSLLLMMIPLLGKVEIPTEPEKSSTLFGLNKKPQVSKQLLGMLLDMLLLPYGALTPQKVNDEDQSSNTLPVPPGMCPYTFKRVTENNPLKPEDLEQIKLGIVKFISNGIFPNEDILIHMVVAAADTRFSVANLADMELKKVVNSVDWSVASTPLPLYRLFFGSLKKDMKPDLLKTPASTRIRLKLLTYLCKVTDKGFMMPASIQIFFESFFGTNTNARLKTLALNFTSNLVRYGNSADLPYVAKFLQSGLVKLINEGESAYQGQAFVIMGMLAQKYPSIVYHSINLLSTFFKKLESETPETKLQIREGFLNLICAYKYDVIPEECDKDGRMEHLFNLVKEFMNSEEPMVRFVAVRSIAIIFPPNHVPSKFLLLLATGDNKEEVSAEAVKSLYGTSRKTEVDLSKSNKNGSLLPRFSDIINYVYSQDNERLKRISEDKSLTFDVKVYTEVLIYLRLCMIQNLNVPLTRELIRHPCDVTPIIRNFLKEMFGNQVSSGNSSNSLLQYVTLIQQLMLVNPAPELMCCMLEVVGCVPELHTVLLKNIQWLRDLLNSLNETVRELAALLYAIVINQAYNDKDFEEVINYLNMQCNCKSLEIQHGSILAIGNCVERRIMLKKYEYQNCNAIVKNAVNTIVPFLSHTNSLLVSAACNAIGLIAKTVSLPLEDGVENLGSPDPKRSANNKFNKMEIVNQLFTIMNDAKVPSRIREKAARTLGLLCIGECFPHTKFIMQGFLNTAKETKDVEVHFTIGESLVMCVQSLWSPECRDAWSILPNDYVPETTMMESPNDENLIWLLKELLNYVNQTHPNSRQASCIWLLALLKNCGQREPIKEKLQIIQNAFMNLLSENNDIVQDVASKGLYLVFEYSQSEELLKALVEQLTTGKRHAVQVTENTKLFEDGQLGTAPSGGNLTTYKELCSLASDLNKPDLIYQFMHLANHNSMWNSKKGAAFGFSSIAEKCGERLKPHLHKIIPKLYRYQFDPNPNIQMSMQNIWRDLVSDSQKTLDEYHNEILEDLLNNLTSNQYRTRQSCCLAFQDFLKGAGNRSIHDSVHVIDELWMQLFRVMDDHHEATRLAAVKTGKVLSKLCVRGCDVNQGKAGIKMMETILPVLLNKGITNTVAEVRAVSLQTVSELVGSAGKQLKPFLHQLIPALLQAAGELESTKLMYLSTVFGAQSQAQEVIDSERASRAKSHFTTETVSKCLQFADVTILEELVPKVTDLMKQSVGLGTRIVCAHFITLLVVHLGKDLQPYTGKLLRGLVNGLTDRNSAIRKQYSIAIGHLISTAKDSSTEKLFAKVQELYFEREDDTIRSACAYTVQSIGHHNQEILKSYSDVVLPLVFFAMHVEKTPETENTLEIWNDIWTEHSPGTETGIRQNIEAICIILKKALESPSWMMKAQAANAVGTVAIKLGVTMDIKYCRELLQILLNGLGGRTWNGKDKLLKALANICSSCKDSIKGSDIDINDIIEVVLKESRKEEINYKISCLESLGEILSSLKVDKFDQVYNIVQDILSKDCAHVDKDDDEDMTGEEMSKRRESNIKLRQIIYETLGKAWPENSMETQAKYRELFVEHCNVCLPTTTRAIQVSIMCALNCFVDKLFLLQDTNLNGEDKIALENIIAKILIILQYSLTISKHTRLRKEALNIVFSLATKLKEKNHYGEFDKLKRTYESVSTEILKDNQPEIKSRVIDINNIFKE